MKKLILLANRYIQESDWKILALVKFCLLAMGVLWGLALAPTRAKRWAAAVAAAVFALTYPPLMLKLFCTARQLELEKEELPF